MKRVLFIVLGCIIAAAAAFATCGWGGLAGAGVAIVLWFLLVRKLWAKRPQKKFVNFLLKVGCIAILAVSFAVSTFVVDMLILAISNGLA